MLVCTVFQLFSFSLLLFDCMYSFKCLPIVTYTQRYLSHQECEMKDNMTIWQLYHYFTNHINTNKVSYQSKTVYLLAPYSLPTPFYKNPALSLSFNGSSPFSVF